MKHLTSWIWNSSSIKPILVMGVVFAITTFLWHSTTLTTSATSKNQKEIPNSTSDIRSVHSPSKSTLDRDMISRRLRIVLQVATERNLRNLNDAVVENSKAITKALKKNDWIGVKFLLQSLENRVGISHDGKEMDGVPIAQLSSLSLTRLQKENIDLQTAINQLSLEKIETVQVRIRSLLGENIGKPDLVEKPIPLPTKLYPRWDNQTWGNRLTEAYEIEKKDFEVLQSGRPNKRLPPQTYANLIIGILSYQKYLLKEFPNNKKELDETRQWLNQVLQASLQLQMKSGFFSIPDLRDHHLRYEALINKLPVLDDTVIKNELMQIPLPDGWTIQETSRLGIAFLQAGKQNKNKLWLDSAELAGNWICSQVIQSNSLLNAEAISFLVELYLNRPDEKYLKHSVLLWQFGLSPMQIDVKDHPHLGAWSEPYQVRMTHHLRIYKALTQLEAIMPTSNPQKQKLLKSISLAEKYIEHELARYGATDPELLLEIIQTNNQKDSSNKRESNLQKYQTQLVQILEKKYIVAKKGYSEPLTFIISLLDPKLVKK